MIEEKKAIINSLIKRLEEIRDTDEIKEISVEPFHIVEEYKTVDGKTYGIGSQNIEIRYEKMFVKKSDFDKWEQLN